MVLFWWFWWWLRWQFLKCRMDNFSGNSGFFDTGTATASTATDKYEVRLDILWLTDSNSWNFICHILLQISDFSTYQNSWKNLKICSVFSYNPAPIFFSPNIGGISCVIVCSPDYSIRILDTLAILVLYSYYTIVMIKNYVSVHPHLIYNQYKCFSPMFWWY